MHGFHWDLSSAILWVLESLSFNPEEDKPGKPCVIISSHKMMMGSKGWGMGMMGKNISDLASSLDTWLTWWSPSSSCSVPYTEVQVYWTLTLLPRNLSHTHRNRHTNALDLLLSLVNFFFFPTKKLSDTWRGLCVCVCRVSSCAVKPISFLPSSSLHWATSPLGLPVGPFH